MREQPKKVSEQLAAALDAECRFRVGDMVVLVSDVEQLRADVALNGKQTSDRSYLRVGTLRPMMVVERYVTQCHGGIQVHYGIRRLKDGHAFADRWHEYELHSWEAFCEERAAHIDRKSE